MRESRRPEFRPDPPARGSLKTPTGTARRAGSKDGERFASETSFPLRAGFAGLAATAAFVLAINPGGAAPKKEETSPTQNRRLSRPSATGTCSTGRTGKGRICYTLAQPKTRDPASLKRDPGYAFISDRPTEGVRNEVSFIMGFDIAASADAQASPAPTTPKERPSPNKPRLQRSNPSRRRSRFRSSPVAVVDDASFDLLPKGANLWVKNAARESALVAEMKKGVTLLMKAASIKGNASTDTYSLEGFSQAMDRLQKECSGKP